MNPMNRYLLSFREVRSFHSALFTNSQEKTLLCTSLIRYPLSFREVVEIFLIFVDEALRSREKLIKPIRSCKLNSRRPQARGGEPRKVILDFEIKTSFILGAQREECAILRMNFHRPD